MGLWWLLVRPGRRIQGKDEEAKKPLGESGRELGKQKESHPPGQMNSRSGGPVTYTTGEVAGLFVSHPFILSVMSLG